MSVENTNDSLLDMFIFETMQLTGQLEESVLISEKEGCYNQGAINEIFRIMHTIKGSAAMMMFENISVLAHGLEDLFFYLREEKPELADCSAISDLILEGADFIKEEVTKIQDGLAAEGDSSALQRKIRDFLINLKNLRVRENVEDDNSYKAVLYFEEGCGMENIRAYAVMNKLQEITQEIKCIPEDILDSDESADLIRNHGFVIFFRAKKSHEEMNHFFMQTIFLKDMELIQLQEKEEEAQEKDEKQDLKQEKTGQQTHSQQSIISVHVAKLDKLMDLVGEMVIAEAMVVQNPDLKGLELNNFRKAAGQLRKITTEMQDTVMSIRMVSLSTTFNKMHRVVRDMCKKLEKDVRLEVIGEDTEVDKNVIEQISDPLMHLVRNAVDHGIENGCDRKMTDKPLRGTVTLEARNSGSDVLITVRDDGKGLNRDYILDKAQAAGLLHKPAQEMTDKEAFGLILLPGFSTNEKVTEFSGRGVGMDVVARNIENIGGSLSIESEKTKGTTFICKIPLTLAIIDGMNVRVGSSCYTIPTISIKEFFRIRNEEVITDPDGNEMIMVRGNCYQIQRMNKLHNIETRITDLEDGILIMVEHDGKVACIFADELLGQQQVVVKTLPEYIHRFKETGWLAGCTLLGDGSISLILDVARLFDGGRG
ncbi:chemotaxis protein CheA [Parasporobacterium paucivorans]|uniref:Chemotaxis protein CheA n=1 Tax=Parasporobacterium paucivorans DSM 15970 TaxID=1122934 RepID=A0A1M6IA91_9FIRM|nr:chemotaxis protein CheA [Parasporobacterium paucivorans]SHJ31384.1 two-component system, chemotaxis family, sensor kinase CheA [Parasporobacterium paucivorans DSM 15970]